MVGGESWGESRGVETLSGPLTSHIHAAVPPHYPDGRSKRSEVNRGGGGGHGVGGEGASVSYQSGAAI